MFAPLAEGIARVLEIILNMVQLLVIASVLVSWVGADPSNQIVSVVRNITEPLYRPFRRLTRNLPGPIDWAPMIVLLLVVFCQYGVIPYIHMLGSTAGLPGAGG